MKLGHWHAVPRDDYFFTLKHPNNILLLAPRRVGKTSVLRRMSADAQAHQFTAVLVDVSDCADERRFVQRIYSAILEHHAAGEQLWSAMKESWLGQKLSRIKRPGARDSHSSSPTTTRNGTAWARNWPMLSSDWTGTRAEGGSA